MHAIGIVFSGTDSEGGTFPRTMLSQHPAMYGTPHNWRRQNAKLESQA
jgi:hypothetical protein